MSACRVCGAPAGNKSTESYCGHPCYWAAGGTSCCFRALIAGKRRLAIRLAQRWIKIQVGAPM